MIAQTLEPPYRTAPNPGCDRATLATATLTRCRTSILPHLASAAIASVRIDYDGGGDEGQAHEVEAFGIDGKPATVPMIGCERHQLNHDGSVTVDIVDLTDALTSLAESALEALHDGWENGEGAFGTVVIDVASQSVTLEHNTRFVSYDTAHHVL